MSNSPSETNAVSEPALKNHSSDEKQNTASAEFTSKPAKNNEFVEGDLEEFAERLGIKEFTENKVKWKKFYNFAGLNFVWPSELNAYEHREVFDYIVDPIWEPDGKELAIECRRLLGSGTLDESKGTRTHVLLVHGKVIGYGNEISSKQSKELQKKFPGCFYAPIVEPFVELRRFYAVADNNTKEWQTHISLRNVDNLSDVVTMSNTEQNFRMVIDTGASVTIIPFFLRQQLADYCDGWERFTVRASGYGNGVKITPASKNWDVRLGDGRNWSRWHSTKEIYSWPNNPPSYIDCGLIGYDVLNNIPHYKPCRVPYVFLRDDVFKQIQQLQDVA
ncbi:hypothetical protein RhiirB3_419018 [Rhizophagus irregularis]|nr:hypothetical protein RhiirB3_419018 [Rhizophagus irregularis]